MRTLFIILLPAAVLYSAELLGFWTSYLSHPWWSHASTLRGIAAGIAVATLWTWRGQSRPAQMRTFVIAASVLVAGALTLTWWGKTEFANSFAENKLAGKFWFFGFKVTIFTAYYWLFLVLRASRPR
jgi:hypothetical protein